MKLRLSQHLLLFLSWFIVLFLASCTADIPVQDSLYTQATSSTGVTVVDLGLLPGGTYASARAINNLSQITGVANDSALTGNKQVIWDAGTITPISACCASGQATPLAINDLREVVAWTNAGYRTDGVYWNTSGQFSVLPTLPGGEGFAHAYDINNSGVIVGDSRDSAFDRHALVWNRTTLSKDLGFMGAAFSWFNDFSSARGINDLGDIVGEGLIGQDPHAFLWRNGSYTDLGLGSALDINNNSLILGWAAGRLPATWKNGVMTNLTALSGGIAYATYSALDLNNNGDIVGFSTVDQTSIATAVLWQNGRAKNLGYYPGGDSSRAYGINDKGQIVGEGSVTSGGPMHALMWTVGTSTGGTTNTPPSVTLTATTTTRIASGGSVSFHGSFTDPDAGPWTYTFNWGNGSTTGTVSRAGNISATRTFASAGRYQVTLTVKDAKGASGKSNTIGVRVQ
jgi:probable HAF family extracellular repeat protein